MKITKFQKFRDIPENFTGVCKVENVTIHYENGKRHREDGPAVEDESNNEYQSNGSRAWYIHGQRHRIDGPAVEFDNGKKEWYINDKPHRLDGPAMIDTNGLKSWWIDGTRYTEEEFNKIIANTPKEFISSCYIPGDFSGVCKIISFGDICHYKDGKLHRTDGPAVEYADGSKFWYLNDLLHRVDGPAIEYANGDKYWYLNDLLHREDGPAIEYTDGSKEWFVEGKRHRVNQPAIEWSNGAKKWYLNGLLHREDGPAIEGADGTKFWYKNGKDYTEEFNKKMKETKIELFSSFGDMPKKFTGKCKFSHEQECINDYKNGNLIKEEYSNGNKYWYKNDLLHREDGPAVESSDIKEWYKNGKLHRLNGPAVEYEDGRKEWYKNGELHREDGPACEFPNGRKEWWSHNMQHRLDGPAVETENGDKFWYKNGSHHRTDGPAVEYEDGGKYWWINGSEYSETEFNKKINKNPKKTLIKKFSSTNNVPKDFTGVCKIKYDESTRYYKDGKYHREDGPAIEFNNGTKSWWLNGKRHRLEYANGDKVWYKNGKTHREDGPAIECGDIKKWYIDGKEYLEEEFNKKVDGMNIKEFASYHDIPQMFTGICKLKNSNQTRYYKNGVFHREDGPAIINKNGSKFWHKNGLIHREDGPAAEFANGDKAWMQNDKYHRLDGPACEYADGRKEWYIEGKQYSEDEFTKKLASMNIKEYYLEEIPVNFTGICKFKNTNEINYYKDGQLHREDGPAIEYANGTKKWYKNGNLHREDGPAVEYSSGGKEWYINGNCHRLDGPAKEFAGGTKHWFINGEKFSEEEFNKKIAIMNIKEFNLFSDVPKDFTGICKIKDSTSICYYKNGQKHREDGPAVEADSGYKAWWLNGTLHRTDGPAIENNAGGKSWYINGKYHRLDGPAIEYASGQKEWYLNGKRHREDGPAIEWADGTKFWCLNDEEYSQKEFNKKISKINIKEFKLTSDIPKDFTGICEIKDFEQIRYYKNGLIHREDGPAVEWANGNKEWCLNGELHRLDGPALENLNGSKEWFLNGKRHRTDGPAVENADGTKEYWIDDNFYQQLYQQKNIETSFIRRNSNQAFYRIAAEQCTNIIKQFIISAISKSTTIENAHQILNTNVGKILLQSAIGLVLNDLNYDNVHIEKITEEMLISSITNVENTIIEHVINQTINNTSNNKTNSIINQDLIRIQGQQQVCDNDLFEEMNNYESLKA